MAHLRADILERYALGRPPEKGLARVEEHLLLGRASDGLAHPARPLNALKSWFPTSALWCSIAHPNHYWTLREETVEEAPIVWCPVCRKEREGLSAVDCVW
jgi:hypothetical protein